MISANEARSNVTEYEIYLYGLAEKKVNEIIPIISESIEFHSKNGFTEIEFTPYGISRFSSYRMMEIASTIFNQILKENGYKILVNDWEHNILKIRW